MNVAETEKIEEIYRGTLKEKKILIIEDEPGLGSALQKVLKNYLKQVDVAKSCYAALKKLGSEHYDLILSDIIHPKIKGIELMKKIKNKANSTPIILMTYHPAVRHTFDILHYEVDDFLIKPFNEVELTTIIYRILSNNS